MIFLPVVGISPTMREARFCKLFSKSLLLWRLWHRRVLLSSEILQGLVCLLFIFIFNNPACSLTGSEQRRGLGLRLSAADDLLDRRDHAGQHDPTDVHQWQRCSGQSESRRGKDAASLFFLIFSLCLYITHNASLMKLPAGQSLSEARKEREVGSEAAEAPCSTHTLKDTTLKYN